MFPSFNSRVQFIRRYHGTHDLTLSSLTPVLCTRSHTNSRGEYFYLEPDPVLIPVARVGCVTGVPGSDSRRYFGSTEGKSREIARQGRRGLGRTPRNEPSRRVVTKQSLQSEKPQWKGLVVHRGLRVVKDEVIR